MPNQPDPRNVQRAQRIPRPLDKKIIKKFKLDDKMSVKEAYILAMEFATKDVKLTHKEYLEIAEETRQAEISIRRLGRRAK